MHNSSYRRVLFTTTGPSDIQLLKFWLFNFSNFQVNFVKNFIRQLPGFKIDFESTDKVLPFHQYLWSEISRQEHNNPLNFFLKFARKTVLILKFWQMREILKPQFCWYFKNVLLWVILIEMKVSQVGCFQISVCWICYYIFSPFIVFFTTLISNVFKETILVQLKFQKSISRCSILQKIRISNFVILKWRSFEYKVENFVHFWGSFFTNKKCWHFEFFMNQIFP